MEKLIDVLKREGKRLEDDFDEASSLGYGTSQEISEFRENSFRNLIERFYPLPYRVTKGKIHDSYENPPSNSIDCIIVNPVHPNLIDKQGKFQLLLADGIDLAIEIKPDISDTSELIRGLEQGVSVKKLRRVIGPIVLINREPEHIKEFSRQIPYFIFSIKGKISLEATVSTICNWYKNNNVSLENQVDIIVINKKGILKNIKYQESFCYSLELPVEQRTGWFFEEWKEATLAGMLLNMELSYKSTATIQEGVLQRYLGNMKSIIRKIDNPKI